MDISSLLSPSEAAQSTTSSTPSQATPLQSPKKHVRGARAASLKQGISSSPLSHVTLPPTSASPHGLANAPTPSSKASLTSPTTTSHATQNGDTPPPGDGLKNRQSSTPSMDALADLASMQHHQPSRTAGKALQRSQESYESQLSPSTMYPTVQRPDMTTRSSFDLHVSEISKPAIRTDFTNTSLPIESQQRANQLAAFLQEKPHSYHTHVEMIKLIHQGFVNHVYPPSSPESQGNPHTYDLLKDLRLARESMDKQFAIGEDLWTDWIQDESTLARTLEQRMTVMDKCQKAVEEEYGSTRLWLMYGEWMLYNFNSCQDEQLQNGGNGLSDEDRLVGKEVFTWDLVMQVWKKAAEETKWRVNDSHEVWNKYMDLTLQDLAKSPTPEHVIEVKKLFEKRLKIPQADWDGAFQRFSNFISTYLNHIYEETMKTATRKGQDAKAKWNEREMLEIKLQRARDSDDINTEYSTFFEYIEFEREAYKKKKVLFELVNAIYERADLRFPTDLHVWEDHTLFVIDESLEHIHLKPMVLPLLDRATRHCPWSGSLWSQYLLTSEKRRQSIEQTSEIKHKATNTGLLEEEGMEEVLKVHMAWCNYLRRRAFTENSIEDDLDVAEVGIRSAIEMVQELGVKIYGKDYQGDPRNRLDYVYVKFLSQSRSWDTAREVFKGLIPKRGDSYDFWMRYYIWEMIAWAKFTKGEQGTEVGEKKAPTPSLATAVLRQGMKRPNLDWPEKMMYSYLTHCEDHEDPEVLQRAIVDVRKMERVIAKRRENEAAATAVTTQNTIAAATTTPLDQDAVQNASPLENGNRIGKRKRDGESNDIEPHKKTRNDDNDEPLTEASTAPEKNLKRDRENATILIHNLPHSVADIHLRQYFRDCGKINTLKVIREPNDSATAIVEFDEKEAATAAQTRDGRDFENRAMNIQIGSGSTIFVANYPPTADETYIRELFNKYGEIIDIRFPSLKYNTHRRFCYVQFKLNAQAQAATERDGDAVEDSLRLVAKVSNPLNKQNRSGATAESREVYVRNVHWDASEKDVKNLFAKYGKVESVRIPRNVRGKSKGFAYVVFSTADEANAALDLNDSEYLSRRILIEIVDPNQRHQRQSHTVISHIARSVSPYHDGPASPSAMSIISSTDNQSSDLTGDKKSRTIALLNIPDTVNDARIRALAEPHGALVKLALRPDHQGAILEYREVEAAGKAALGLDGSEIVPGRTLSVGSVAELLRAKAEKRGDKILVGKARERKEEREKEKNAIQTSGVIKRPGAGIGRRGGLGVKRGFGFANLALRANIKDEETEGGEATNGNDAEGTNGEASHGGSQKTQDDFRAMVIGKTKE